MDMAGAVVRDTLDRDVALARELGVTSTPAVYLDGRLVPKLCLYNPVFWEAASSTNDREERIAECLERDHGAAALAGPARATEHAP